MKYDCKTAWPYRTKSIQDIDLFVIQYILESRNISIDLYKDDNIYALGSIKISRQRSNCTHEHYHGKVSSDHLGSNDVLLDTAHFL